MWMVAAASGSEFHAGPSQVMHWISLEGEGAVVSVRSGRVAPERERERESASYADRTSARGPNSRDTPNNNHIKKPAHFS